MSLPPISRDAMLSLKALKDEEIRQKAEAERQRQISQIVANIYKAAKTVAETTTQTSYSYKVPEQRDLDDFNHPSFNDPRELMKRVYSSKHSKTLTSDEFHITNMEDIVASLRDLFPGCVVNYSVRSFARGQDGKEYDITTLDASVIPFVTRQRAEKVITVDWS